ncbi:nucleotidyltransferase family protein [Gracilimonas sp.]|uniref:nucleotidyltransferase family protein n=1 Tax=Gracilimonas sp. TaxID=1974203 RepID=UPI002871AAE6|nr:nucleotidyltransferase domain-containing protein [Gracilimonas sp.]
MDSIITHHKRDISNLCKTFGVESLYVFGSAASNSSSESSDIDFLISFQDTLSPEEYSENYFSIRQAFTDLFEREIDLVTKNSLSNPYFIESIDKTKVLIYDQKQQEVSI